jgi:hypothetical protein
MVRALIVRKTRKFASSSMISLGHSGDKLNDLIKDLVQRGVITGYLFSEDYR